MEFNNKHRISVLLLVFLLSVAGVFYTIKNLKFEEKFTSILPKYEKSAFLTGILDNASFFNRVIIHVSSSDSTKAIPAELVNITDQLIDSINKEFVPKYIIGIDGKTRANMQDVLYQSFASNLPLYLTEADYQYLDSLIGADNYNHLVEEQIKIINSPAGIMAARYMFNDPLGVISKQLLRLKDLQIEDNLIVYRNYLLSKDKRHLIFFLLPNAENNGVENRAFIQKFEELTDSLEKISGSNIKIEYSGGMPIAVANEFRIKRDVQLTVNLALIVIILLILYFYRRWQYLFLVLFPALIGAVGALVFFTFFFGSISAISIGIGSVLLGISVDYALHIFTHLKHQANMRMVIKDVALPVMMSSITTASAFLSLLSLSSPALRQLGMFAAISVIVSALVAILILPFLLKRRDTIPEVTKSNFIEGLARFELPSKKWNILSIVIITFFLSFFIPNVRFEDDLERLNYMPSSLKEAEQNLDKAGNFSGKKSFLLSEGATLNEAIINAKKGKQKLDSIQSLGIIEKSFSPINLLFSKEEQQLKINRWNKFWTQDKIANFKSGLSEAAIVYHIKPQAYSKFFDLLEKTYVVNEPDSLLIGFSDVAGSFRLDDGSKCYLATVINLQDSKRQMVNDLFIHDQGNHLVDKKIVFSGLFNTLQTEFDKLLYISLVVVFLIILIFLGRIELALVTYIPILVSWLWTLGMIGMLGIKLNFFNIVICSLIFGLGIDYAIFITRGLMQKHKTGTDNLRSFKSSIILSALTTLTGLGVLLFAKHPALRSIASVAVIGILSSVIISFSLQRPLFRLLVGRNDEKRRIPVELIRLLVALITFLLFGIASIVFTILIIPLAIVPIKKVKKQYFLRYLTSKFCQGLLGINLFLHIKKLDIKQIDFTKPSIIVVNHQSMLDILLLLSLSPKIIILTKDWVWNNLIFGALVRYSGHLNISKGHDNLSDDFEERINEGCSIVIFPEGTRTDNGKIKRYHKGAFYMAEKSSLPVHKLLIYGFYDVLPRKTVSQGNGNVIIKYISTYNFNNPKGNIYSKIAKSACAETRLAYNEIRESLLADYNHKHQLLYNFIYMGPVLEHYIKVKLRLDKLYRRFHELLPKEGIIYDLGCGYGLMSAMLKLRCPNRNIIAADLDEEKIYTANNTALAKELGLNFHVADVVQLKPENAQGIIFSDVLHYLTPQEQIIVLENALEGLTEDGVLLIRDGDASKEKRHRGTKLSEFLSTGIGFNLTRNKLNFFSIDFINDFVSQHGLSLEIIDETRFNSNIIYKIAREKKS